MQDYISLGLNIALLIFVFFGIFWGFIRGLRKTACRGIFLISTMIVLILVTPLITKSLLGIKLNVTIELDNLTISGSNSLRDIVALFIKDFIGTDFITKYPEFTEFVVSIPVLLINAILYVILFWLCKYLLYPLNFLFYKIAFAPRKKKEALGFSDFNNEENNNTTDINFDISSENLSFDFDNTNFETNGILEKSQNDINIISETQPSEVIENPPINKETTKSETQTGLFIINDPEEEFHKHEKLTAELKELTTIADKKEKKRLKKEIKKERKKIKKHRLLGALVGGACGLVVMLNTLIPVYGLLDVLEKVNAVKLKNITEEETSLGSLSNGLTDEILNGYKSSVFEKLSKYSGIKGISLATFDSLTTTKFENNKITLREDVESLATTIQFADNLIGKYKKYATNGDLADLTKEEITILLSDTKNLLNETKKIKTIDAISDYILPFTCNYIIENEMELSSNPIINRFITDLIVEMLESNGIDLFSELSSLIDIAEYLNNKNLLTVALGQKIEDPITIIQALDDNFASEFTGKIYQLKLVDVALPYIMNITFTALDEAIDFGYVENTATRDQLKTSITNVIDKSIIFAKTLNSSNDIYLTENSLIPLGEFIDSIKNSQIINETTYSNLITFAKDKITEIINPMIPEKLQPSINNEVMKNLNKVSSWRDEMTIINQAITLFRHKTDGFLGEVVEGEDLRSGFSIDLQISEPLLKNVGKALDVLEGSKLFGFANTRVLNIDGHGSKEYTLSTMTYIMCDMLDYIQAEGLSDFNELNEFILKIQNNLISSEHVYDNEKKFWESELTTISPLVIELNSIMNAEEFEITASLGRVLDDAKRSTMLGNNACITLINNTLNIVKDNILGEGYVYNNGEDPTNPQILNDKIYELFDGISTNLHKDEIKENEIDSATFWEVEIDKYISLINIADKSTGLTDLKDATSLGEDLDNAFTSKTIPKLELSKTFAFAIRETKSNTTDEELIEKQINTTIDNIASKLEDEEVVNKINNSKNEKNFWQIEFSHISKLMDINFEDDLSENLVTIGTSLDEVVNGYTKINEDKSETNIRGSKLITHEDLRLIISASILECKASLTNSFTDENIKASVGTAMDSIAENMSDTTNIKNISFAFELGKLNDLSKLDINADYFKKGNTESNQNALSSLGSNLDKLSFNSYKDTRTFTSSLGNFNLDVHFYSDNDDGDNTSPNSKIVSRNIINQLIIDIMEKAKITKSNNEDLSTNEEAFNKIIDGITEEIEDKSNNNYVFSWLRELTFINKLIQLDFEDLETTNIANKLGSTFDAISFNTIEEDYVNYFDDMIFYSFNENNKNTFAIIYLPGNEFYNNSQNTVSGNSLFITRETLLVAVDTMLSTLKETRAEDENVYTYYKADILNELLDNTTSKVATIDDNLQDTANYYTNIREAFNDLTSIEKCFNSEDEEYITIPNSISDLTYNTAEMIDKKLEDIQNKKISGSITTRKLAIYILERISIPDELENTEIHKKLSNILAFYKDRNDKLVADKEYYYTTSTIDPLLYPNPFVSLKNLLPI